MIDAGLPLSSDLHRPAQLSPDAAAEAIADLIDQGVEIDAIVAASDRAAIGAIKTLVRRGRSIPGDVAIVGFDDIKIAGHIHPPLTTIRQNTMTAGRLLVSKLLSLLAGNQASSDLIECELIIRESCGAHEGLGNAKV